MQKKLKMSLDRKESLILIEILSEFLYLGQHIDSDAVSDENMTFAEALRRNLLKDIKTDALEALSNILSDTDQVTMGNGVDGLGKMYPDVEEGLRLAEAILKSI